MLVLVGYATANGSTRGVAERIAARLRDGGCQVDCRPLADVTGLDGYDAFVLGSAIHGGGWLPPADDFLRTHVRRLAGSPVWLFSVSSVGESSSAFSPRVSKRMRAMRKDPPTVAETAALLRPRAHHWFAGVIARGDWGAVGNTFLKAMGGRYGDHRNWDEIDGWAAGIARELPVGHGRRL